MSDIRNNLCRLCLSDKELVWVFDSSVNTTENFKDVIYTTTGVEILEKDVISQKVCGNCCKVTLKMFEFRERSVKTDKFLKEQFAEYLKKTDIKIPNSNITIKVGGSSQQTSEDSKVEMNKQAAKTPVQSTSAPIPAIKIEPPVKKIRKVHESVSEIFTNYPNIKLPSGILSYDLHPSVCMELDAVEDYYACHNLNLNKAVQQALRLSRASKKTSSASKQKQKYKEVTVNNSILPEQSVPNTNKPVVPEDHSNDKISNNLLTTDTKDRKVSPISIKLVESKSIFKVVPKDGEKSDQDSEEIVQMNKSSNLKRRRLSSSDFTSDAETNHHPTLMETLELRPKLNIHKCYACLSVQPSAKALRKHIAEHLRCNFCNAKFRQLERKERHEADCATKHALISEPYVSLSRIDLDLKAKAQYPALSFGNTDNTNVTEKNASEEMPIETLQNNNENIKDKNEENKETEIIELSDDDDVIEITQISKPSTSSVIQSFATTVGNVFHHTIQSKFSNLLNNLPKTANSSKVSVQSTPGHSSNLPTELKTGTSFSVVIQPQTGNSSAVVIQPKNFHSSNAHLEPKTGSSFSVAIQPKIVHSSNVPTELKTGDSSTVAIQPKAGNSFSVATHPKHVHSSNVPTGPKTGNSFGIAILPRTGNSSTVAIQPTTGHSSNVSVNPTTGNLFSVFTQPKTGNSSTVVSQPKNVHSSNVPVGPKTDNSFSVATQPKTDNSSNVVLQPKNVLNEPKTGNSSSAAVQSKTGKSSNISSQPKVSNLSNSLVQSEASKSLNVQAESGPTEPSVSADVNGPPQLIAQGNLNPVENIQYSSSAIVRPDIKIKDNFLLSQVDTTGSDLKVLKDLINFIPINCKVSLDGETQTDIPTNRQILKNNNAYTAQFKNLFGNLHVYKIPVKITDGDFNVSYSPTEPQEPKSVQSWSNMDTVDVNTPSDASVNAVTVNKRKNYQILLLARKIPNLPRTYLPNKVAIAKEPAVNGVTTKTHQNIQHLRHSANILPTASRSVPIVLNQSIAQISTHNRSTPTNNSLQNTLFKQPSTSANKARDASRAGTSQINNRTKQHHPTYVSYKNKSAVPKKNNAGLKRNSYSVIQPKSNAVLLQQPTSTNVPLQTNNAVVLQTNNVLSQNQIEGVTNLNLAPSFNSNQQNVTMSVSNGNNSLICTETPSCSTVLNTTNENVLLQTNSVLPQSSTSSFMPSNDHTVFVLQTNPIQSIADVNVSPYLSYSNPLTSTETPLVNTMMLPSCSTLSGTTLQPNVNLFPEGGLFATSCAQNSYSATIVTSDTLSNALNSSIGTSECVPSTSGNVTSVTRPIIRVRNICELK